MSFNQIFFLENIESIVGILSFGKSCEGKKLCIDFHLRCFINFFLFLNVLGVIT